MHIHIHKHIHIHTHIHIIHTYVRTYVRTYVHTYIHTYSYTYLHTYLKQKQYIQYVHYIKIHHITTCVCMCIYRTCLFALDTHAYATLEETAVHGRRPRGVDIRPGTQQQSHNLQLPRGGRGVQRYVGPAVVHIILLPKSYGSKHIMITSTYEKGPTLGRLIWSPGTRVHVLPIEGSWHLWNQGPGMRSLWTLWLLYRNFMASIFNRGPWYEALSDYRIKQRVCCRSMYWPSRAAGLRVSSRVYIPTKNPP